MTLFDFSSGIFILDSFIFLFCYGFVFLRFDNIIYIFNVFNICNMKGLFHVTYYNCQCF